jgi:hypothetical protein
MMSRIGELGSGEDGESSAHKKGRMADLVLGLQRNEAARQGHAAPARGGDGR